MRRKQFLYVTSSPQWTEWAERTAWSEWTEWALSICHIQICRKMAGNCSCDLLLIFLDVRGKSLLYTILTSRNCLKTWEEKSLNTTRPTMTLTEPHQKKIRTPKPQDIIMTSTSCFKMWEDKSFKTSCPTMTLTERHQKEEPYSQATRHQTRTKKLLTFLSSNHLSPIPLKQPWTHKRKHLVQQWH